MFAAELAAYLLLVLRRPTLLGAGTHSGLPGLAAALAVGRVLVLSQPPAGSPAGRDQRPGLDRP
jgi:hypothetical protein